MNQAEVVEVVNCDSCEPIIKYCICIEGNCALHVKNNIDYSSIDFGNGRKCFRVFKENNNLKKEIL